jgi:hypothetical protein
VPIVTHYWNVPLRQEIPQVDDGFDVAGKKSQARNGLAEEKI